MHTYMEIRPVLHSFSSKWLTKQKHSLRCFRRECHNQSPHSTKTSTTVHYDYIYIVEAQIKTQTDGVLSEEDDRGCSRW